MSKWSNIKEKRVVSFLIVDNDKTLAEQSVNGLFDCFEKVPNHESVEKIDEKYKVKIFELSSNTKVSLREIITHIDAYACFPADYKMPLIVILANPKQMKKFIELLAHIRNRSHTGLCAGIIWDEADKVYPQYREKSFSINGVETSYIDFIRSDDKTIYRTGFVTATDGELLEDDTYEECMNAYHYPIDNSDPDYRAIHHSDSKLHYIECPRSDSNNKVAEDIICNNWVSHFSNPYTLPTGERYFHKTIVNSNSKGEDMKDFANLIVEKDAYCMTFNQNGIILYTPTNKRGKKYTAKKKRFCQVLFYIYKMNKLHDRPLFIIGRRKVDRGLGFHYAPRRNGHRITTIDGSDGFCQTDGVEGLIWTNLILGNKIDDDIVKKTGVQKVGRGAGIIGQCPQYPGEFHYWMNQKNADDIIYHYNKVDNINRLKGSNSMVQAITRALNETEQIIRNHSVDLKTFRVIKGSNPLDTLRIMKEIIRTVFGPPYVYVEPKRAASGFYVTSLNTDQDVAELLKAIKKVPTSYGTRNDVKIYRRFLPCYSNLNDINSLYIVIPLIDPNYTQIQKDNLDEKYGAFMKTIPQTGNIEGL
jgi:hypothetical protein